MYPQQGAYGPPVIPGAFWPAQVTGPVAPGGYGTAQVTGPVAPMQVSGPSAYYPRQDDTWTSMFSMMMPMIMMIMMLAIMMPMIKGMTKS